MMQAFEWYVPDDHKHWQRLANNVAKLKATGIDNIWVPPGCKASSPSGNGYDIYDLYDLGEFDQKGSKGTKWGTKDVLMTLVKESNDCGMGIYWDAGKLASYYTELSTTDTMFSFESQSCSGSQGEVHGSRG